MFNYWVKNRLLLDLIAGSVASLSLVFAFALPNHLNVDRIENENSIYLKSEIDYQLPSPSTNQLSTIEGKTCVDEVFGYYLTKTSLQGKTNSKVNFVMSDDIEHIEFTMFNKKTLIRGENSFPQSAAIDEKAASVLGVTIGDDISLSIAGNSLKYKVSSIYSSNSFFKEGTVLVEFAGDVKSAYESVLSSNSYSGAFVKTNNYSEFSAYLKDYVPEGRLKERSEFDTDEEFNTYNNAILNGNYTNEISDFTQMRKTAQSALATAERNFLVFGLIGSAIVIAGGIVSSLLIRRRKSEEIFFSDILKDKKRIKQYRLFSFFAASTSFLALSFVMSFILGFVGNLIIPICLSELGFAVSLAIDLSMDSRYLRR